MPKRVLFLLPLLLLCGCGEKNRVSTTEEWIDTLVVDTFVADTISVEQKDIEKAEETALFDRNFDDFVYVFLRSSKLQKERVKHPLPYVDGVGDTTFLTAPQDWKQEFSFLDGDFHTVIFDSDAQFKGEQGTVSDSVLVQRIDLNMKSIISYDFQRIDNRWMLCLIENSSFLESGISDFLHFYSSFASDSLFQRESIASQLHISIGDVEDDEEEGIEGTIDAEQWSSFCTDVPNGIISNIIYGQTYHNPTHMVLQKCGTSNGLEEIFVFDKQKGRWKLTSYEN